jgi:hypothetical protein|tara:strand:+ start:54 stop:356 length:303 start_codon:yes stop_codon:yes gene_type:complete
MNKEEFIEMICTIFSSETLAKHKIKVIIFKNYFKYTFSIDFVALDNKGSELPIRCFTVSYIHKQGWVVTQLKYKTTNVMADIIQNIIVGEVAKELLIINQ